jgi:type IV secretion system protein VirD4
LTDSDLTQLRAHLARWGGRLYLGTSNGGLVLAAPQQAVLVLGPPRSGKTTAIAIPNVLCAPGPVIATSTKPDLLAATVAARSEVGRCWLFDPTGTVSCPPGLTRLRWSPVAAAATWDESLVLAAAMSRAARPAGRRGESAHWTERAEALLAPLLHAAHMAGSGIEVVLRWVLRQDLESPQAVLAGHGVDLASDVLAGIAATDPREQSGIWSSAAGILAAYRSDAVLDNSTAVNFDPTALTSTCDTVYICASARHQDLVAPIVVAFVEQARAGCYAAWPPLSARPALSLVLDELANIAPMPDLPALVSEGGSQGVLTLACLQDLSQARVRWGPAADGFLSLFGTKVVLPGIGDLSTLELVSRLGGEIDVPARSVSRAPWWTAQGGAPTVTWSHQRQRRVPVEAVSQQKPGTAILLAGSQPPEQVVLRPWWSLDQFRANGPATIEEPARNRRAPGPLAPGTGRQRGRTIGG